MSTARAQETLRGVFDILPTPFDDDGELDEPGLARLIDFVIDTGVDGVTILGFLGEAAKLSEAERAGVIDITVETANGRVPVLVGATHAATDRSVAFAREAQSRGAAGLLLAPPALARPSEAAVRRHYEAVAAAVDLPIVVQDFPAGSGVYMTPAFIGALAADIPACRWLKLEDAPTPQKTTAVLAVDGSIGIFGGLGGAFMLEELERGAVGVMTGFGFPEILVSVYRHCSAGEMDAARDTFYHYLPLIRFENQAGINLPLRKHIYRRRGAIDSARTRAPHAQLDEITLAELGCILEHLGLEVPGLVSVEESLLSAATPSVAASISPGHMADR